MELQIATKPHWDSQSSLHTIGFSPNVFPEPRTELRKQEAPQRTNWWGGGVRGEKGEGD